MSDPVERMIHLKRERGAVILAHNYQIPPIQDAADFCGDSLALAMIAQDVDSEIIVFCGVDFMAETAKILNPEKKVVHPVPEARCPMAAMIDLEVLRRMKEEHDAPVVAYVNTTAETKAEADICCTSANAVKVVRSLDEKKVIFIPDENLGKYVQRKLPEKELIIYPGYCHVHRDIEVDDVLKLKRDHPDAEVLAHPECRPEVIDLADFVYSTEGMVRHASNSDKEKFIILTEEGLAYRIWRETGKRAYSTGSVCPNMKKITVEDVIASLERLEPCVDLDSTIMTRGRLPIERMLEVGRGREG